MIQYPLYLIPHGGGYASIVDPDGSGDAGVPPAQVLVVFGSEDAAHAFMQRFEVLGAPRVLRNDREFRWLLSSLKAPVVRVGFDAEPVESEINARWLTEVQHLLDNVLEPDRSPWNYPVFALALETGLVSVTGSSEAGEPWTAVALFSRRETALDYLRAAGVEGTPCEIEDLEQARRLLVGLQSQGVNAVAPDPLVGEQGRQTAEYCFSIDTLLDRYLVADLDPPAG